MAKGNPLIGTLKGKIGDVVFSRQGGEQRSRAYIPSVRNPRTRAQMAQRVKLANLVAFYRSVIRLFPSAFQNKPANQSDYNQFVSKNMGVVNVYLTKQMALAGACIAAPYQVTHGTLSPIIMSGQGISAKTNILIGADFVLDNQTTVAELTQTILDNNQGWAVGMQLSYVSALQSNNPNTGYPILNGYLYEMTLSLTDTTPVHDLIPEFGMANVGGYIGHGASAGTGGFAWVKSQRGSDGQLKVSSQQFMLTSSDLYNAYNSTTARTNAMNSYGEVTEVFLDPASIESAASGDSGNVGTPRVSSISVAGVTLTTSTPRNSNFAADAAVVIRGANLSGADVKLNFITASTMPNDPTSGAQEIASVLTDPAITGSSISGNLTAAKTGINHVVVVVDDEVKLSISFTGEDDSSFG